jgi:glycosyltransferase involved in cell wall biosynthesis
MAEARDLVSVVIPCFNQARFLPHAIESILAQTYSPIEIVVVDDGSPDDTAAVAKSYPSVRLVSTTNQGLPTARNNGFAAATGSLVVFLDADDRLLPDAVARGVAFFDDHPECGMVLGRHVRVLPDGSPKEDAEQPLLRGDGYEALLRGEVVGCTATALFRREAVEAVAGFSVDPLIAAAEDYDFYLRVARRYPIAQHDAVVAEMLYHEGSMHRDFALMLRSSVRVLRRQRPHARASASYRNAYRAGLWKWRTTYGVRLARRTFTNLRSPSTIGAGLRDLTILLRFYPGALLHAARRAPGLLAHWRANG